MLQYLNLGIDFGAVAAFALAFKFDLDKAAELNDNVKEKLKSKRDLDDYGRLRRWAKWFYDEGKDDFEDLPVQKQAAAKLLGSTEETWDQDDTDFDDSDDDSDSD